MRLAVVAVVAACSAPPAPVAPKPVPVVVAPPAKPPHTITIIGTNDLHGALERLPLFAGFVANVRAARAKDGGGMLLLDGGDMFQGTLESNVSEGFDVVRAYNELGYAASAVGNHEFDYGPIGPDVVVHTPDQDPRGALKARASEAKYPFLVSNIAVRATHQRIDWPNMPASALVEVGPDKIGIIGASTEVTPQTTMTANIVDLEMMPTAPAIIEQAKLLHERGAKTIVVVAHVGSKCRDLVHHEDISSCDQDDELFRIANLLPTGTVDAIVAGHTHAGIAQRVHGIAVIESFSSGRGFGRIDLHVAPDGHVISSDIFAPTLICPLDKDDNPTPVATCHPEPYEERPVVADAKIQAIVDAALAKAGQRRADLLGPRVTETITRAYRTESALGDLFGDLMLGARPDAQVALTNGGGLRADLPAGALTYGQLFEAMPFDNRFSIVEMTGAQIKQLVITNLQANAGIFSWGGLTAKARCKQGALDVAIAIGGKPLVEAKVYKVVTSDFLANGGDGAFKKLGLPANAIRASDEIMRDGMAAQLRKMTTLSPTNQKRLDYPGVRPVSC